MWKRLLVILSLLLYGPICLFPQNTKKEPNIVVYTHSGEQVTDESIKTFMNTTVSSQLRQAALNAIIIEHETTLSELLESAGWLGAFFLVDISYTRASDNYTVELNGYSTWDKMNIVSREQAGTTGDEQTADYSRIIDEVIQVINEYLETEVVQTLISEMEEELDYEEEEVAAVMPEDPPAETSEDPPEEIPIEPPTEPLEKHLVKKAAGSFIITAEAAPFVAVGEATEYFTLGLNSAILGGYSFSLPAGILNTGLAVEVFSFNALGVQTDAQNIIVSLGAEVQYFPNVERIASTYYKLAGGAGYFVVNTVSTDTLTKIIPYIAFGTGAVFQLTGIFGVYAGIDFHLYIERSTVISGFSPSLGIYLRLNRDKKNGAE